MVFALSVVTIVLAGFVSAALFLPIWALAGLSALSIGGIAFGARTASRHDEVKGAMGVFSALLLTLATVVLWIVYLATHL
jgi:hypothetical protein